MQIHQIPLLRNPIMVMAFSGWNDAGAAASGALDHLLSAWSQTHSEVVPVLVADIEPEDFYDFQVNRPSTRLNEFHTRTIDWPSTEIYGLALPHFSRDLVIVKGVEPSMRWPTFTHELLDLADDLEVSMIVTLGSLLADVPHSRPISVNVTAASSLLAKRLGAELSTYEGPTGILGVIHEDCMQRGIDSISLWAPVPHYASNSPSPKSSLALIHALEDFLELSVPQSELAAAADVWEVEINDLAKEDTDVADYIKALEESKDAADIPGVSGEMIAQEFERYLRRRSHD